MSREGSHSKVPLVMSASDRVSVSSQHGCITCHVFKLGVRGCCCGPNTGQGSVSLGNRTRACEELHFEPCRRYVVEEWHLQERAAELAEHEESLDAWKRQFKEQATKQIGDRERALADWQAKLEAHDADLAERRTTFEVGRLADGCMFTNTAR